MEAEVSRYFPFAMAFFVAGLVGTALAPVSRPQEPPRPPPRLDSPEFQLDQVGPLPVERPAEPVPETKRQKLEDLELGGKEIPAQSLSPKAIRKVQLELAKRGYDPGSRAGVLDDKTRDAIKRYQADRGWPATGKVTVRLLVALHGGDSFRRPIPKTPRELGVAPLGETSQLVLAVQDALRRHGYDVPVNGRLDARTVRAIETYQSYVGLEPTGEATEELLAHIQSRVIPLD